jgi:hypothetical protein
MVSGRNWSGPGYGQPSRLVPSGSVCVLGGCVAAAGSGTNKVAAVANGAQVVAVARNGNPSRVRRLASGSPPAGLRTRASGRGCCVSSVMESFFRGSLHLVFSMKCNSDCRPGEACDAWRAAVDDGRGIAVGERVSPSRANQALSLLLAYARKQSRARTRPT